MARHRAWAGWGESFSADGDLALGAFDGNRLLDLQQTTSFNKQQISVGEAGAPKHRAMGSQFSASIQERVSKS
jgi:hypothetical protein